MSTPPPGARARARSASQSPSRSAVEALPPMPIPPVPDVPASVSSGQQDNLDNRGSFGGFLKRGKSTDKPTPKRTTSTGNKLTKRQVKERQPPRELLPKEPPQIPGFQYSAPLGTFDSDGTSKRDSEWTESSGTRPSQDSRSTPYGIPIPAIPGAEKGAFKDPYDPTTSLSSRGRPGYASSVASTINSPRRVRRRNDPTPFNILVIGGKSSGKTSFINFLVSSLAPAPRKGVRKAEYPAQTGTSAYSSTFVSHYLETEFDDGEHLALTIWDSEGLEPSVADLQMREITGFVESKFAETLNEEVKVARTPGVRDTHIHAVFLLLDPSRLDINIAKGMKALEKNSNGHFQTEQSFIHPPSPRPLDVGSLDDALDLQLLKSLEGKTTVIPIISKADTIPLHHVDELKRSVGESLKKANLDPLEKLSGDADNDDGEYSSSDEEVFTPKQNRPGNAGRKPSQRDDSRGMVEDGDDEDISNQSVLNLSDSSSDASSATSRGKAGVSKPVKPQQLFLPNTIISPLPITAHEPGPGRVGRRFAWGFADPYNSEHCDYVTLKDAVFSGWRTELREAAKELWYENWRTTRLDKSGALPPRRDLSGPPTTGRGARMGAQMKALRDQGGGSADGHIEESSGGLQPTDDRQPEPRRPGTSPAAYPGQDRRLGASPSGMPRELDPRARASPAGLRPNEVPAHFTREHEQRTRGSPASQSREFEQRPRGSPAGHPREIEQWPRGSPAGHAREFEQRPRGSPGNHAREFEQWPRGSPGNHAREFEQRPRGSPAAYAREHERSYFPQVPGSNAREHSPHMGPMPGGFPSGMEQRSEPPRHEQRGHPSRMAPPITGPMPGDHRVVIPEIVAPPAQEERRKPQVPWPLQ